MRNVMSVRVFYKPMLLDAKKGKFKFYVVKKYQMFPEMQDEFDMEDYPNQ